MAITHTGGLRSRPRKGTDREVFVQREADRLGVTVDRYLRFHHVLSCGCRESGCEGWQVVPRVTGRGRGEA